MSPFELLGGLMVLAGVFFCVVGAVGLLRFPDFYTRTHAASITDTLGAGLVLWGLLFYAGPGLEAVKLVMVAILILITSPTAGHALVKAAYANGLAWTRGEDALLPVDDDRPVSPRSLETLVPNPELVAARRIEGSGEESPS